MANPNKPGLTESMGLRPFGWAAHRLAFFT